MCACICDGEVLCVYVGFEGVGDLVGGYVVSCDSCRPLAKKGPEFQLLSCDSKPFGEFFSLKAIGVYGHMSHF